MRIIIAGCGKIGKSILISLIKENHEIAVIDSDPDVISSISDSYDVLTVCAKATDITALKGVGVSSAELFIAATGSDENNMLSSFLAKRMGASHTVARISSQSYDDSEAFYKRQFELSMIINPDLLTARAIANALKFPSAVKSESFTRHLFEMAELNIRPQSPLDGALLYKLREKIEADFLVCCVLRDKKAIIPNGSFTLKAGDRIGLLAAPNDMQKLLKSMGILNKCAKDVMILGASKTAVYLAEMLTKSGNRVKIIEKDLKRCTEISSVLPRSVSIIHGDGSRHSVLSDEGIESTDAYVTLTGIDEENILSSYYALDKNVPKIITKVNQEGFGDISEKLGLSCAVSPRRITADAVTQYARALYSSSGSSIETLYSLMNGSVEAMEFSVSEDFKKAGIPLRDLNLKQGILLAGIIRGTKTVIPKGIDVIMPHDRVIVISAGRRLYGLSDILL